MRRRTLLLGGLALAGCATQAPPRPSVTSTTPAFSANVEVVRSAARGTDVTLVVLRPRQALDQELPVCVALHGRGSDARMIMQLGIADLLNTALTPFAMVGLDGGDSFWVARDPADDPQRMLTEELPGWLGERNLVTTPFAAFGISMGAYGALNYARRTPHPAVAAVSPALFLNWPQARAREAFAGEEQWAVTEPLRHVDALGDAVVGVWCGTGDQFHPAAKRFADLAKPRVARFTQGGHDVGYWTRVLPEVVDFLSARVP
jgi:S-formylglutathione hydrolase FrmB